jgi:hypothetical protein
MVDVLLTGSDSRHFIHSRKRPQQKMVHSPAILKIGAAKTSRCAWHDSITSDTRPVVIHWGATGGGELRSILSQDGRCEYEN